MGRVFELDRGGDVVLVVKNPDTQLPTLSSYKEKRTNTHSQDDTQPLDDTQPSILSLKARKKMKKKAKKEGKIRAESNPWPEPEVPAEASVEERAPVPVGTSVSDPAVESQTAHELPPVDETQSSVDEGTGDEVRILVSSRHLCLASVVFSRMLHGPWAEGRSQSIPLHEITANEWDTEALLIVLNIIHGRNRSVPRSISEEMLVKVAVIVDYYDCHEVTEFASDIWIQNANSSIPTSYDSSRCLIWLCISLVFSQADIFRHMTELIIMESSGPFETIGLPLPGSVLGESSIYPNKYEQAFQMLINIQTPLPKRETTPWRKSSKCLTTWSHRSPQGLAVGGPTVNRWSSGPY